MHCRSFWGDGLKSARKCFFYNFLYDPPSHPSITTIWKSRICLKNPSVFFQFLWPLLGKIAILQKILHLLFSHDMFRQLVSCSRGGLFKTEETFLQTKTVEIFWPQKVKVGVKRFDKNMVLKNWTPMGFLLHGAVRPSLSPSWSYPSSMVSLPVLPQWQNMDFTYRRKRAISLALSW